MTVYRLWTPKDTYRGTVEADTKAAALLDLHRKDRAGEVMAPELGYDAEIDAIIWPDDATREELGDVEDWRIEPADEASG